jgi:enolase-phosphatase E1
VTAGLRARGIRSVLLDIEGTTTPIAFVYDVLFPYARARLPQLLRDRAASPEVRAAIDRLRSEWADDSAAGRNPPAWSDDDSAGAYALWLMDQDRKSPGLKTLQGLVWDAGYRSGALQGEVFSDVPAALTAWRRDGLEIAIYSSGSVLAQRLLFGTTRYGDLTPLVAAFFDTGVGPKTDAGSYRRIADALQRRPAEVLFVSDVAAELDAARAAGMAVALSIRPGNRDAAVAADIPIVRRMDEIVA